MKIAILHYTCPPIVGGVESVLARHAILMTKAGYQVTVFAGRGKEFDKHIPVRILPLLDSKNDQVLQIKHLLDQGTCPPEFDLLRDRIAKDLAGELAGFDVVIAHNVASLNKNLPLTAALQLLSAKKNFPRMILWHHDIAWVTQRYLPELHSGYPWDLLRTNWKGVTQVTISEIRRKELSNLLGIPPAGIHVIPNGVDFNSFYKLDAQTVRLVEHMDLLNADPLLLLPVRLTPRKNIELALKTLVKLRKMYPKIKLLVTGPEGPHNPANLVYKQKLLALRDELKLQDSVIFLAEVYPRFMKDAVISDLYRIADALFFPSREEGFGIPLLEAAFGNIPVFCADIPVLRELGKDDVSYFDPEADPAAIASLVASRLENEITSRWARRAKHNYSWESIYRNHIQPLLKDITK